jgi:hypothetical protein
MMDRKIFLLKVLAFLIIFVTGFFWVIRPIYGQITPSVTKNEVSNATDEFEMLRELLGIIFSFQEISSEDGEIPYPTSFITPQPSIISPSQSPSQSFSSLRQIFEEVGGQVGVPPLILEAVMLIEMPSTFNFTPEQIKEYSTPGNVIPGCRPNVCAATGPMQMTIGVDDTGNSLCPKCCWKGACRDTQGGCPNAWVTYGSGRDPCNLKDNVYGAARKLKSDSGAGSSVNWTQDQVYQAARRYYGDCTVAYSRLGDRTYCEYVWWYYNTN